MGNIAWRLRAAFYQPVSQSSFNIFGGQIVQPAHENTQMERHRTEHSQSQFRLALDERCEFSLLNKQNLARLQRARIGWISSVRRQCGFSKGFARPKHMDYLLFSGGIQPMHVQRSRLNHKKSHGWIAFSEKVIPLGQFLKHGNIRNIPQISSRQSGKQLAPPQRIDYGSLFKLVSGVHDHYFNVGSRFVISQSLGTIIKQLDCTKPVW